MNTIQTWEYIVYLDVYNAEKDSNNRILIKYNGDTRIIQNNTFKITTLKSLTMDEVLKMIEGTKGIKEVAGVFKITQ